MTTDTAREITVETETVRRCRQAREAGDAGRAAGAELAAATAGCPEIADAISLELGDAPAYGTEKGQPTEADWDWFYSH